MAVMSLFRLSGDSMKICMIAFSVLIAVSVQANTNNVLNWKHCLERTRQNSPDLAAARAAVRELEYGVSSASAGFLPQIDASARVNRGQNERELSSGQGTNSTSSVKWVDTENVSAGLELTQDLFSGGNNLARRRRALAQLEVGEEQYRDTLSDVELRLRQAFVEVVYAKDLIELTSQIAERRENNVRLIQLRFDGGRENAGSLARSMAQLSVAEYEQRQAERSLAYAYRNLAAAMGSLDVDFGVDGELQAGRPEETIDVELLVKQTPGYIIAKTQVKASKQGLHVARSSRFPSVTFSASTGLSGDRELEFGEWNVGLRASMPIFTGNRINSEVAAEKEKVIQSEMEFLDTANSLAATLQQRLNSYTDAVENEAVQKQSLDAEMLRAEISTAKYKQGLLSYEDWDQIESNLINQGKTYLQRRRTSELEQARWKNALGLSEWFTEKGE
jgi:outer membrane protein TolC